MTQWSNDAALDSWAELGRKLEPVLRAQLGDKFDAWTRRMNENVVAYAPGLDESSAQEVLDAMNAPWVPAKTAGGKR